MSQVSTGDPLARVGSDFVRALATLDFERIQACFHSNVRFRALVPSTVREGFTAAEAAMWFQNWFGDTDELHLLSSSVDQLADRVHISYQMRGHEATGWYVVGQQAYCTLADDLVSTMNLLCSGFRPDPNALLQAVQSESSADAFYDAGTRGCADGPLDEIAELMRGLAPGQTLSVHAADPSVAKDLPAWCRMVGHDCFSYAPQHFLIRHK